MDMRGEVEIGAEREKVWDALNDPDVLRRSITGCESLEKTGDDTFAAKVRSKIGPVSAVFTGDVRITDAHPPERYTIQGEGKGGAAGFAKGGADVALEALNPDLTRLTYDARADVGGKLAQLGARLVQGTAKKMADDFFTRFKDIVEEDGAGATAPPATDVAPSLEAEDAPPPATANGSANGSMPPAAPPRRAGRTYDEDETIEGAAAVGAPHMPDEDERDAATSADNDPSATPGGLLGSASTTSTDAKALHEANQEVLNPSPQASTGAHNTASPAASERTPLGFMGPPWVKWALIALAVVIVLALLF